MTYHDQVVCWLLFTVSRDFQLDSTPESMTSQTEKAKAKLAILSSSLDDLEAHLEPLFAQTLPETVLGLEPIQQAKLQTVLPYLVYDLIFSAYLILTFRFLLVLTLWHVVYLKSRGIDPKTHSVVSELVRILVANAQLPCFHLKIYQDRVKQYFDKITAAENPPTSPSPYLPYLVN